MQSYLFNNNSLQATVLFSPAIGSFKQTAYELTKALQDISLKWYPNDPNLLIILDSSLLRVLTYHFQQHYSYTILFKHGTNDYSFEYIEYIINKLQKLGYSFLSSNSMRNFKDLNRAIARSEDIYFYVFNSSPSADGNFSVLYKTIGSFILKGLVGRK